MPSLPWHSGNSPDFRRRNIETTRKPSERLGLGEGIEGPIARRIQQEIDARRSQGALPNH
jgi:hypothetical protein